MWKVWRPKLMDPKNTSRIWFDIETDIKEKFEKLCKKKGFSISSYLRVFMINEVENEEKKD